MIDGQRSSGVAAVDALETVPDENVSFAEGYPGPVNGADELDAGGDVEVIIDRTGEIITTGIDPVRWCPLMTR